MWLLFYKGDQFTQRTGRSVDERNEGEIKKNLVNPVKLRTMKFELPGQGP
jgi:hypothetical protein